MLNRADDIPLLAQFFVQKYAPRVGRQVDAIEGRTIDHLLRYDWPGNIRELENIIERALILSSTPTLSIGEDVLPVTAQAARRAPPARPLAGTADLDSVQREHILTILQQTDWIVEGKQGAATKLGMKPATLRHRMKKLGICRPGASAG